MQMKKTWFSYFLWFLYTAVTGVLLALCMAAVSSNLWGLNQYIAISAVCILFALIVGFWFAGRKGVTYISEKISLDEHFYNMWECFFVMIFVSAAILYRFYQMWNGLGEAALKTPFYEMAMITDSGEIPNIVHGASYIYTIVLSTVFSFIGNKVIAGVWLQCTIHIFSVLVLYFAVKNIAGRLPGIAGAAVIAFSPVFMKNVYSLTPEALYFFLYILGLLFVSLYMKGVEEKGYHSKLAFLAFFLVGGSIGMLTYLDIAGITLLFFIIFAMWILKKEEQKETEIMYIKTEVSVLGILVGSLVTFAAALFVDAIYSGQSFANIVLGWCYQYGDSIAFKYMTENIMAYPALLLIIFFLAALSIIGFWKNKTQKADIWILVLISLSALKAFGIEQMNYDIFIAVLWGILAGIGLDSMKNQEISKESCEVMEPVTLPVMEIVMKPAIALMPEPVAKIITEPALTVPSPEQKETKTVTFIENPLPLPKKHMKKELTYQYEVEQEKMDFDINIKETDDFDLKD